MKIHAVNPGTSTEELLPGAQFVDAYRVLIKNEGLDARMAAELMLEQWSPWFATVMRLRNHLVSPFGLKSPDPGKSHRSGMIGMFPVVSSSPGRLVAGFDDTHLDFRIIVDVSAMGDSRCVTATTRVLTHNRLGRIYHAVMLPLHWMFVRTMLRRLRTAAQQDQPAGSVPPR